MPFRGGFYKNLVILATMRERGKLDIFRKIKGKKHLFAIIEHIKFTFLGILVYMFYTNGLN